MAQKLSDTPSRAKRLFGTPMSFNQMSAASSSSSNTVHQSRSGGSFSTPVMNSHAKWMASRLK